MRSTFILPKGLCIAQAATAPASRPAEALSAMMHGLLAVGLCVLVVWIIRRIARPAKLALSDTPGRPNRISPVHIAGLLLVWLGAGSVVGVADLSFGWRALAGSGIQALWLGLSLVVAAHTFSHGIQRGLGLSLRHWVFDLARAVIAYLAILPACVAALLGMIAVLPKTHVLVHPVLEEIPTLPLHWQVVAVFSTVVMAPLAEEMFFRGLLQSMLRRQLDSPWAAVILGAVIFTGVHVPAWQSLPSLFILSVVLGYNYERTGRLTSPILIHAIFNAVFISEALLQHHA